MKTFINMLRDDSGASAAEYALILAIIGGAIALAAITLGKTIGNSLTMASSCIAKGSSAVQTDCP
jgi:pilus assembly protein Flp/PilA